MSTSPKLPSTRQFLYGVIFLRCPIPGASPYASKQLRFRRVELCSVSLWVVPVAEHPGQFLALQADHHRAVVGDAAGMVNLPRQKEAMSPGPWTQLSKGFSSGDVRLVAG